MSFTVIIPVRYDSTRLPGKALLDIAGKPLLRHVFDNAAESGATTVIVATDDARIRGCAESFGATVCVTSPEHRSGTDRVAEAAAALGKAEDAIVVNVQGDEPLMPGRLIGQVVELLKARPEAVMATLCDPAASAEDVSDPNVVKVVADHQGYALYFSRAPIPWNRDGSGGGLAWGADIPATQTHYRHIGLYAYRAGFLQQFSRLPPCLLETTERLEQLRALYYGFRIAIAAADCPVGIGVDTQADLDRVRALFAARL